MWGQDSVLRDEPVSNSRVFLVRVDDVGLTVSGLTVEGFGLSAEGSSSRGTEDYG